MTMSLPRRPANAGPIVSIDRLNIRTSGPLSEVDARHFAGLVAHALAARTPRNLPAQNVRHISVAVGAQTRGLTYAADAVATEITSEITSTFAERAR